jgi:hypothetical protein
MKKLNYLFAAIIMVAALVSCEKNGSDPVILKKGDVVAGASLPVSLGVKSEDVVVAPGVVPQIIPGANRGGNRTCDEVATYFGLPVGFFYCGDKIDYENGSFRGSFPDGLTVTVKDGTFVSFKMDACILIGDKHYKVGAVIVKGSNNANIYYYEGGTMGDSGLASPVNPSGKPAGLSNLSFCFVECEEVLPELVIALKTYIGLPDDAGAYKETGWAVSGGIGVSTEAGLHMGYNIYKYNGENGYVLNEATLASIIGPIGSIKARDFWEGPVHYLEVVIDTENSNILFGKSYLYVGSLEGYTGRYFTSFPFIKETISGERIFKIDFTEIHY